jgi:hypothetical protein
MRKPLILTRTAPERIEPDNPREHISNQSKKLPGHEERMEAYVKKENDRRTAKQRTNSNKDDTRFN